MLYLTLISVYTSAFQEVYFVGLCPSNIPVEYILYLISFSKTSISLSAATKNQQLVSNFLII